MMMIVLRLLSLLGLKSLSHRPFSSRLPNKVFFQGRGRGVAGFVDSGPKTLMPSASNRSTPEWTRVDSSGLPPPAIRPGETSRYSGAMRVFLITGASSGIGAAAARTLAAPDTAIALHARKNRAGAERVAQKISAAGAQKTVSESD